MKRNDLHGAGEGQYRGEGKGYKKKELQFLKRKKKIIKDKRKQ